jgi:PAS domain S-box-containing protein
MLGYTGEELLTLSFKDITHPDDLHSDDQLVRQLLDGKISQFQVEKRYMNKKGHIVWGLLSVSLVRDANEIPLYFIDQLQDITLRKQAEEKLRKVEQNIRAIITTVGEGVVVVDSDSRIRFVNEELLNIFGYSEKELIGESIQTLMPKDRRASHASGMKKHLNGAPPKILGRRVELKGLHKDGSTFPIELRIEETKEDSGVRFFTGAIRDITERKQAEEELRNSKEEAEEATKLKDKYVSLVAHDLKSPLGTLVSILELIKSRRDPGLSGNTGKAFMLATSNAKNMMNLINDVLDVGRFKSGQIKLNRTFIDCIYSTTKVAMIFDEMAKEKGIKLVNEVAPETMLYADPVLFEEVIKNLLSNAIKFCREGDQITIYTPEGNKTAIAVKDTGPGIQKNILPDVFKEEVKTSTKGTAGETGTGLGLPYSKDIMEAHGGNLTVESEEGKGTEFIASLPYVDPENSDADNQ